MGLDILVHHLIPSSTAMDEPDGETQREGRERKRGVYWQMGLAASRVPVPLISRGLGTDARGGEKKASSGGSRSGLSLPSLVNGPLGGARGEGGKLKAGRAMGFGSLP